MRKKIVLESLTTLCLAVFVLAAYTSVAFAITQTEHLDAGATCLIEVPGHPKILVVAMHMDRSGFYSGSADRINLFAAFTTPSGGTGWKLVSAYEDNPERWAFSNLVGGGPSGTRPLVEKWQIQIFKICKTVFMYWTVPLVMPATTGPFATPEVILPPGCLMLRGSGDVQVGGGVTNFPSGWKMTSVGKSYEASASLFCLGWHYCGPASGTEAASVQTDGTATWTNA